VGVTFLVVFDPAEAGSTARLPKELRRVVVACDPNELAVALDAAVSAVETTFVLVVGPDSAIDCASVRELISTAWDAPAVYPTVMYCDRDGRLREQRGAQPFSPHRLKITNYVGPTALVRRAAWLAAGGWGKGAWDLWLRLAQLKPCPTARYWLRGSACDPPPLSVVEPPLRATFYAQANAAQTYFRCQLPARSLRAAVQAGLPAMSSDPNRFPEHRGAAIFSAPGDAARALVISLLQEEGVPVLVDVDDDYLEYAWVHERAGWTHSIGAERLHSTERHREIVASADAVVVSTEALSERYRRVNSEVFVCPNAVEPSDWPEVERLADGIIRVGWFASSSHAEDRDIIEPALAWAAEQPNVEVTVMGVGRKADGEPWWDFPFRHIGFDNDIRRYWLEMSRMDIGVAPVASNAWSVCRSDLKALEYAMAGACPVLSDVLPYSKWRHGEGCLKAESSLSFVDAVKQLVRAPERARALASEARSYVLTKRTVAATQWRWEEAISVANDRRSKL
jgi:glycosyltransferase involved in cell wall biosynthesis